MHHTRATRAYVQGSSGVLRYGGDARFVALVGLGKGEAMASETRRGRGSSQAAGAAVVAACKASKCKTAAVAFVGAGAAELLNLQVPIHPTLMSIQSALPGLCALCSPGGGRVRGVCATTLENPLTYPTTAQPLQELAYGVVAAPGESDRFKSEPAPAALESVAALTAAADGADAALKRGVALARGNLFARYLVEAPPNVCSPAYLAGAAAEIAEQYECMSLEVLERADCEGLGMGCYLGVAQVRCLLCKMVLPLRERSSHDRRVRACEPWSCRDTTSALRRALMRRQSSSTSPTSPPAAPPKRWPSSARASPLTRAATTSRRAPVASSSR